jgi:thiol-disulfide isomerase/thioredoxin
MRTRAFAVLSALSLFALALPALAAPLSYRLKDARDQVHTEAELKTQKLTVFVFMAPECPLSNRAVPELNRLAKEYGEKGVAFYGVSADPAYSAEVVRKHDEEFGLVFPTLLDPGLVLVHHAGARVTPEVAVVAPDGAVLYVGRIDDRAVEFGKVRTQPKRQDLRAALDEALSGKPVSQPVLRSIGCAIPGATQSAQR